MTTFPPVHSHPDRPEVDPDLHEVAARIHQEYDDRLGTGAVDQCLSEIAGRFAQAKVRPFVPLLVGRYAREELQARLEAS